MPSIVVREGGPVVLPRSVDGHRMVEQLLRYSAAAPFPCFRLKRGALHAAEIVGTIQLGKLRLSILPKSAGVGEDSRDKEFLLNLLRAAGYLSASSLALAASVRATSLDPLEAMLNEVGNEMLDAVRDGAPRRYEEVAAESETLRGRIDFGRLSRRLPGVDAKLAIRYTPLSPSNVLSRTLRWTAESLTRMARSAEARQVLAQVLSHLDSVSGLRPTRAEVLNLSLSRYERRWHRTITIAQLLVDGKFIDPTFAGRADAFGMLFPLQHLFERALRQILAETGRAIGLRVVHRSEALHMLHDEANEGVLRLRPDYVFLRSGESVVLGDAKWKRLVQTARAYGAERADVYQMNAYLTRYDVACAALFVPRMSWMAPGWHESFSIPPLNRRLHLVSVDIERLVNRTPAVRNEARGLLLNAVAAVAGAHVNGPGSAEAVDLLGPAGAQFPQGA